MLSPPVGFGIVCKIIQSHVYVASGHRTAGQGYVDVVDRESLPMTSALKWPRAYTALLEIPMAPIKEDPSDSHIVFRPVLPDKMYTQCISGNAHINASKKFIAKQTVVGLYISEHACLLRRTSCYYLLLHTGIN